MRRSYRRLSKAAKIYSAGAAPHSKPTLDIEKLESRMLLNAALSDPPLVDPFYYVRTNPFGGAGLDSPTDITIDNAGNALVTGIFEGTVDFNPDTIDSHTAVGSHDIFITKLNQSGVYEWTKTFGGTFGDFGQGVAVDSDNNIFLTGSFFDTVDFDPSIDGIYERSSNGANDIFLTKLDSEGNHLWTMTFGAEGYDQANAVAVDSSNNIIITGDFTGAMDFDPSANEDIKTNNGNTDGFITKINHDDSYGWTNTFGGEGFESSVSIALDSSNSIFATGRFELSVDFDPRSIYPTQDIPNISEGGFDTFITKYSTFGPYSNTVTIGGEGWDQSHGITIGPNNNVFITGEFSETVDFNP
ncbi:MAG: hypothetical protein GY869_26820, partial [Planctomycetes bacterium]|nr:hypothetical protein [Planctomycetota bacterium]